MSICAAHCSWVCCSKSTSRMTSYSSSVSRIGSVFSHPLGQNVSTCGTPQIRRHRGGLGMGAFFPLYSVYSNYSTLSRKKQFFSKTATFSVLISHKAGIARCCLNGRKFPRRATMRSSGSRRCSLRRARGCGRTRAHRRAGPAPRKAARGPAGSA